MTSAHATRRTVVAVALAACLAPPRRAGPRSAANPCWAALLSSTRGSRSASVSSAHGCHPNALAGLGPGIIDQPIPGWLVRLQVRVGFGVMPAFSAEEIDDEELDALLAYLDALRGR